MPIIIKPVFSISKISNNPHPGQQKTIQMGKIIKLFIF